MKRQTEQPTAAAIAYRTDLSCLY